MEIKCLQTRWSWKNMELSGHNKREYNFACCSVTIRNTQWDIVVMKLNGHNVVEASTTVTLMDSKLMENNCIWGNDCTIWWRILCLNFKGGVYLFIVVFFICFWAFFSSLCFFRKDVDGVSIFKKDLNLKDLTFCNSPICVLKGFSFLTCLYVKTCQRKLLF